MPGGVGSELAMGEGGAESLCAPSASVQQTQWGVGSWPELNEGVEFKDCVPRACAGQALAEFYAARHAHSASRAGWLQRILSGQVSVDGQACTDPSLPLPPGTRLVYRRRPWREPPAPCSLEVLWEDSELLVVNKPPGLQVIRGGSFHHRTLLTLLALRHQALGCAGDVPAPVHRLGRGTSGIVICAKTSEARATLSAAFARDAARAHTCPAGAVQGAGQETAHERGQGEGGALSAALARDAARTHADPAKSMQETWQERAQERGDGGGAALRAVQDLGDTCRGEGEASDTSTGACRNTGAGASTSPNTSTGAAVRGHAQRTGQGEAQGPAQDSSQGERQESSQGKVQGTAQGEVQESSQKEELGAAQGEVQGGLSQGAAESAGQEPREEGSRFETPANKSRIGRRSRGRSRCGAGGGGGVGDGVGCALGVALGGGPKQEGLRLDRCACGVPRGGVTKVYRALVQGWLENDSVTVEVPIGKVPYAGVAGGLYAACPTGTGTNAKTGTGAGTGTDTNAQTGTGTGTGTGTDAATGMGTGSGKVALSKIRVLERRLAEGSGEGEGEGEGEGKEQGQGQREVQWQGQGHVQGEGQGPGQRQGEGQGQGQEKGKGERESLVEVDLFTGRAHQIRIHTACTGHPLVGEPLYAAGGVPMAALAPSVGNSGTSTGVPPPGPAPSDPETACAGHPPTASVGNSSATSGLPYGAPTPVPAPGEPEMGDSDVAPDGGHLRSTDPLPGDCGYLLHAFRVAFHHPSTGQCMELVAAPPPRLQTRAESGYREG